MHEDPVLRNAVFRDEIAREQEERPHQPCNHRCSHYEIRHQDAEAGGERVGHQHDQPNHEGEVEEPVDLRPKSHEPVDRDGEQKAYHQEEWQENNGVCYDIRGHTVGSPRGFPHEDFPLLQENWQTFYHGGEQEWISENRCETRIRLTAKRGDRRARGCENRAGECSTPIETLRLSPPEIPWFDPSPILESATLSNPSSLISTPTLLLASFFPPGSLRRALYINVSSTVSRGNSASSWLT
nr:hypothetical protein Iba_chr01cCG1480 [Ipomoea batatas]